MFESLLFMNSKPCCDTPHHLSRLLRKPCVGLPEAAVVEHLILLSVQSTMDLASNESAHKEGRAIELELWLGLNILKASA